MIGMNGFESDFDLQHCIKVEEIKLRLKCFHVHLHFG